VAPLDAVAVFSSDGIVSRTFALGFGVWLGRFGEDRPPRSLAQVAAPAPFCGTLAGRLDRLKTMRSALDLGMLNHATRLLS
jgi:hypothetical protein